MNNKTPQRDLVLTIIDAATRLERKLDRSLAAVKGISLREYQILAALRGAHEATATRVDLADAVGLTPSGVTRALRPLEKLGYVTTERDLRDARRSLATLTEYGQSLVVDASRVLDEAIRDLRAVNALPAPDRKRLTALLRELAHG